jgi:transketolase
MLGIPNMDVYTPAGPHELRYLLSESIRKNKRSYFRIGKFGEKDLVKSQVESTDSPVELIRGSKVALLSHSNMSEQVLSVAEEYRKQKFGQVGFYHFPSIRPWNEKRVVKILQSYDFVTVVEEHWPTGALYSEILRVSNEYSCKAQISRLGPKLNYLHEVCDIQEARKMFGYDVDSIIRYIASL